jgi:ABC-type uncharacterized transport system substrate-binding protein
MYSDQLRRRDFITLLGGAPAAWPLAARAQEGGRMRRIGVLMNEAPDNPISQAFVAAFTQGLQQLGWTVDGNLRIDYRWGAGNAMRIGDYARELVELAPEVILVTGSFGVVNIQKWTRIIPIVFASMTIDPVRAGFVVTLERPGGNVTGFTLYEYAIGVKWLELLKEITPALSRVAVLRDPVVPLASGQLNAIEGVAASYGVEVSPVDVRHPAGIERAVVAFAQGSNGGLIVSTGSEATLHGDLMIALAAQHRLPAVYPLRHYVISGGLIYYGPDAIDPYRRAAGYVDRILKGEKPAELPVQAPTKYELVINLKTARALGLDLPPTLLARADEVIE